MKAFGKYILRFFWYYTNACLTKNKNKNKKDPRFLDLSKSTAESIWAVEYTDCIIVDPTPMTVLDMTLNHLMVRLE